MILVLGGTFEARQLAALLVARNERFVSSLAGSVSHPRLPPGPVRIGGFGGPDGLLAWLQCHRVRAVVDATHPFAERISSSAVIACEQARLPLLRLEREGWRERPGDVWHWVKTLPEAAQLVDELKPQRVFLTTGRQGLEAFAHLCAPWFLVRCVDAPSRPLPASSELLLDRGPYTLASERALLERHQIDMLITKDSGGSHTSAKLQAARERRLPVIVVRRPDRPALLPRVTDAPQALAWLTRLPSIAE